MSSSTSTNSADQAAVPSSSSSSPDRTLRSVPSDDSRNYEGVYYGSSSSESEDPVMLGDIIETEALLADIAEPDEDEEPYDILADNGEFLYEEADQRQYTSVINTAAPTSVVAMDLMLSGSPSMASISEEGDEEDEDDDDDDEQATLATSSTPRRSNRGKSDIIFRPKRGIAPRPPSPPTPMYQIPKDYKVPNSSASEDESETGSSADDRSASSSILTGSMKALVRNIDGVLDEMNPQLVDQNTNDDDSIATDASVGGTTELSGELERAQKVFWEFSGIDATGMQKNKKKGKKKALAASKQSASKKDDTKRSAVPFYLFVAYMAFVGAFVTIFVFLRANRTSTSNIATNIGTEASAATASDLKVSLTPTLAPTPTSTLASTLDDDFIMVDPESSKNGGPTVEPSTQKKSSQPSFTPSLRPSERFVIPMTLAPSKMQDETSGSSVEPTQQQSLSPTSPPIISESRPSPSPSTEKAKSDIESEESFPLPDLSSNTRPWDDDDVVDGEDDFYSYDAEYEYERHHPGHKNAKEGKNTKQGNHHGKQKVGKEKVPKEVTKKKNKMNPSSLQRASHYRQEWHQQGRTSPIMIREAVPRIRGGRGLP